MTNLNFDYKSILNEGNQIDTKYEEILKNANAFEINSIIDEFLNVRFKGKDVSKFKGALYDEIINLGVRGFDNPFISFLDKASNNLISSMTTQDYDFIHNSYIDDLIEDNDLAGVGELGTKNIIFNPNFYRNNKSDEDKQYLLKVQKKLLDDNWVKNNLKFED